jgi:predicted nuclease of predicted toxin-antitoxin system
VPLRILLDEHLSPTLAQRLTALGYEVTCTRDRGLLGWKDWRLLPWCAEQGYAICTDNGADFQRLHDERRAKGEEHPGILVVGKWPTEDVFRALLAYLESSPEPVLLANQVVKLLPQ